MTVMKVSWVTSPLCLAFAQKFLPEEAWVPFFNIVGFIIGTYINAHTKKKRLEALRRRVCFSESETPFMHMITNIFVDNSTMETMAEAHLVVLTTQGGIIREVGDIIARGHIPHNYSVKTGNTRMSDSALSSQVSRAHPLLSKGGVSCMAIVVDVRFLCSGNLTSYFIAAVSYQKFLEFLVLFTLSPLLSPHE